MGKPMTPLRCKCGALLVDSAEAVDKVHKRICAVCDGPLELVDIVRQLWRKKVKP